MRSTRISGLTRQQTYGWPPRKSGPPVDLAPLFDDPVFGADPSRNNDFTFQHPDAVLLTNQTRCPVSAHIRKTRPRVDLSTPEMTFGHIMRAGIPYGPRLICG
ncbi:hypothetical protein B0H14DRAFT_3704757 [Mycena olivaceomarginata]|nr:hypothetical protein B0H14DRAFT_3704757 [Mycena olivaceomarginata]